MSNSIQTKKQFVLNSIPNQTLSYANQLTTQQWNTIINTLRTQTNDNTKYLKELHQWLIGFNSTNENSTVPDESSLFKHVMSITNGDKTFYGVKSFTDTIISTTSGNTLCSTSGSLSIKAFNGQSDVGGLLIDSLSSDLYKKDRYGNTYHLGINTNGPFYKNTIDNNYKYLAYREDIPTKVSQLTNDNGYINGVEAQDIIDESQLHPNIHRDTLGNLSKRWSKIYADNIYSNRIRANALIPSELNGTVQANMSLGDIGTDTYHWLSAYIDNIVSEAITIDGEAVATEEYVKEAIKKISTLSILPVTSLPTEDISSTTIYLLKSENTGKYNIYEEYIYVQGKWEMIGTTEVDLSDYLKKSEDEITGPITLKDGKGRIINDKGRTLLSYSQGLHLGDSNVHTTINGNNVVISNIHSIETHASNTDRTYTHGKANQVLATNGFDTYWADLPTKIGDLANSDDLITKDNLTDGTLEPSFKDLNSDDATIQSLNISNKLNDIDIWEYVIKNDLDNSTLNLTVKDVVCENLTNKEYLYSKEVGTDKLSTENLSITGKINDIDINDYLVTGDVTSANDGALKLWIGDSLKATFTANQEDDTTVTLGEAADKNVDTSISDNSSTNLPTTKAVVDYVTDSIDYAIGDIKASDVQDNLNDHLEDFENPHQVTASQLGLATVATSGSYNDLTDLPDAPEIPEVNDGVLTITKNNNIILGTFSADNVEDITIDIPIPDGEAAYKDVDDAVHIASTKLPTSKAVAEYVNGLLGNITQIDLLPVLTLPTENISSTTIYLLRVDSEDAYNIYDEYIYVNEEWEMIGTTKVDLSDYLSLSKGGTITAPGGLHVSNTYSGTSTRITSSTIQGYTEDEEGSQTPNGDLNLNQYGGNLNLGKETYNYSDFNNQTECNLYGSFNITNILRLNTAPISITTYKLEDDSVKRFRPFISFDIYNATVADGIITPRGTHHKARIGIYDYDLAYHWGESTMPYYYRIWHEGNLDISDYVKKDDNTFATKQDLNDVLSDGVIADMQNDIDILEAEVDSAREDIAVIQNELSELGVNNGSLNFYINGEYEKTFYANSADDVKLDISIPVVKDAAYKDVDTLITTGSTSTNLPTSKAVANLVSDAISDSIGTGIVKSVKVGNTKYKPEDGVVSLPAYPSVKDAAYKNVDTTLSISSTSTDLPTSKAVANLISSALETATGGAVKIVQINGMQTKPSDGVVNLGNVVTNIQINGEEQSITRGVVNLSTGAAANKNVDTSISTGSTSTNLPTSQAVASFVATAVSNATGGTDASSVLNDLNTHKEADNPHGITASTLGLASVATSGKYDDLSGTPTINNKTITIKKNNSTIDSFTTNASSNKTINIELGEAADKDVDTSITKGSTSTKLPTTKAVVDYISTTATGTVTSVKVGTTSYSPSSGVVSLPAYPDVNNSTITIQKNAETIDSFTTNASSNKTINIELGEAADKNVDTSISDNSSTNLPTTKAVVDYVDGKTVSIKIEETSYTSSNNVITLSASTVKTDLKLNNVTNDKQVKRTEMGSANGVATLDANGKVPASQLPSYVDDIIEGHYSDGVFKDTNYNTIKGESGKIYVDILSSTTYRWSGSEYIGISMSLALGENEATAYPGNKGKANADAIADLQDNKVDKVSGKGLSTEDYTTAEKTKLAGLNNYDDTTLRQTVNSKVSKVKIGDNGTTYSPDTNGIVTIPTYPTKSSLGLDKVSNVSSYSTTDIDTKLKAIDDKIDAVQTGGTANLANYYNKTDSDDRYVHKTDTDTTITTTGDFTINVAANVSDEDEDAKYVNIKCGGLNIIQGCTHSASDVLVGNVQHWTNIIGDAISIEPDRYTTLKKLHYLTAPTTSGGSTYGNGTSGQVLTSNGSSVYWGTITMPTKSSLGLGNVLNVASYSKTESDNKYVPKNGTTTTITATGEFIINGSTDEGNVTYTKIQCDGYNMINGVNVNAGSVNIGNSTQGTNIYGNTVHIDNLSQLKAPATAAGYDYGYGTAGQVLMTRGTNLSGSSVYWGTITMPTKSSLGLGNVLNVASYSKTESDNKYVPKNSDSSIYIDTSTNLSTYSSGITSIEAFNDINLNASSGTLTLQCDGEDLIKLEGDLDITVGNSSYTPTINITNSNNTKVLLDEKDMTIASNGRMDINAATDYNSNGCLYIKGGGLNAISLSHPGAGTVDVGNTSIPTQVYGGEVFIYGHSTKGGTDSSSGTAGQVLMSNGSTSGVYWGTVTATVPSTLSVTSVSASSYIHASQYYRVYSDGSSAMAEHNFGSSDVDAKYYAQGVALNISSTNNYLKYPMKKTGTFALVEDLKTAANFASGGTSGKALMSNGSTVYWGTPSSGELYMHNICINVSNPYGIIYITLISGYSSPFNATDDLVNLLGSYSPVLQCSGFITDYGKYSTPFRFWISEDDYGIPLLFVDAVTATHDDWCELELYSYNISDEVWEIY